MRKLLDFEKRVGFISRFDETEPKTVFKLGRVGCETLLKINSQAKSSLHFCREVARRGIKGFENLVNGAGNKVGFKTVSVDGEVCLDDSIMDLLPLPLVIELAGAIGQLNSLN